MTRIGQDVMRKLWSPQPTQLILPTILKLQVLYLLCQQAAFLRVLALQLVDVLLNVFAVDLNLSLPRTEFFWPGGRFGRHLASCIVSTFALQGSKLLSCMSTALEHFCKLRICSKLQNGAGSPAHLSTCVECWRMSSSLDTSATSLSESVKGVHSSTNLLNTCNLPVLGQRQILSVSTLPLLYTQTSRITLLITATSSSASLFGAAVLVHSMHELVAGFTAGPSSVDNIGWHTWCSRSAGLASEFACNMVSFGVGCCSSCIWTFFWCCIDSCLVNGRGWAAATRLQVLWVSVSALYAFVSPGLSKLSDPEQMLVSDCDCSARGWGSFAVFSKAGCNCGAATPWAYGSCCKSDCNLPTCVGKSCSVCEAAVTAVLLASLECSFYISCVTVQHGFDNSVVHSFFGCFAILKAMCVGCLCLDSILRWHLNWNWLQVCCNHALHQRWVTTFLQASFICLLHYFMMLLLAMMF